MKGSWPKVTCRVKRKIIATHALAELGNGDIHKHAYRIRAGWTHEINPTQGITKSMAEMRQDLDELADMLDGRFLNDVLPFRPTAEIMACWLMANLPAYWMFVEIKCYKGAKKHGKRSAYKVRIDATGMRREWSEQFEIQK